MKQGFFLNRVDVDGAGITIDDGSQDAVYIDSDTALAALPLPDYTALRAQLALDLLIHKTRPRHCEESRPLPGGATRQSANAKLPRLLRYARNDIRCFYAFNYTL